MGFALSRFGFIVRWSRRSALPAIAALAITVAGAAKAESEGEGELRLWVPSFAFFFDGLGNKADGAITTTDVLGPPLPEGGCAVRVGNNTTRNGTLCPDAVDDVALTPNTASNDTDVVPTVGGSLEVMTPQLFDVPLAPRLFAHGDAAVAFGFERNLTGERKPDVFFADPLTGSQFDIAERSINGQGSRAKLQIRPLVLGAGIGIALTTDLFGRAVRIKPSFEYLHHEVDLIASVRRAVKQVDPANDLSDFRLIDLHASEVEPLEALGGGLELELDAGRLGPIVVSVFAMGRGYRYAGNRKHALTASNEVGESAIWRFEINPALWRGGVGARFRWVPE